MDLFSEKIIIYDIPNSFVQNLFLKSKINKLPTAEWMIKGR